MRLCDLYRGNKEPLRTLKALLQVYNMGVPLECGSQSIWAPANHPPREPVRHGDNGQFYEVARGLPFAQPGSMAVSLTSSGGVLHPIWCSEGAAQ